MAEEFKFENGDTAPVKRFTMDRYNYISCGQPARSVGEYSYNISVYVEKDLYTAVAKGRYSPPKEEENKIHTGILYDKSTQGLPRGSIVPLKWNKVNQRFDVFTTGLINKKLMVDTSIASSEVAAAVKAIDDLQYENS